MKIRGVFNYTVFSTTGHSADKLITWFNSTNDTIDPRIRALELERGADSHKENIQHNNYKNLFSTNEYLSDRLSSW